MACAFLLAILFFTHVVQVWHILTLSFIVGLGQSFGGPAYSALLPTLVGPEDLANAIAMNSIQFNLARILGPTHWGLYVHPARPNLVFHGERCVLPGGDRYAFYDSGQVRAALSHTSPS